MIPPPRQSPAAILQLTRKIMLLWWPTQPISPSSVALHLRPAYASSSMYELGHTSVGHNQQTWHLIFLSMQAELSGFSSAMLFLLGASMTGWVARATCRLRLVA
jgi:hypothetical protein